MAVNEPKLNEDMRQFVVHALACYETPEAVSRAVKVTYAVEMSRQGIQRYDPTTHAGKDLAKKWRDVFAIVRKAYLDNQADIGIRLASVRQQRRENIFQAAMSRGNLTIAAEMLDRAAEEEGGKFTNRTELTGKNGKALKPGVAPVVIFQLPDNGR